MSAKAKKSRAFPGQHEGETVELVFRQHPIVMRKQLLLGMVFILLGIVPLYIWPLSAVAGKIAWGSLLAVVIWWVYTWVGWFYSVYIVTNTRIIEIKQKGFFNRRVVEFGLDKIQNVNYHIKGFQAVLFQYGDIIVQTYVGDLVMLFIHKPVGIHEQMLRIIRSVGSSTPANN